MRPAEEVLENTAYRAGQPQGRICDSKTKTVVYFPRQGTVVEIRLGDSDIAPPITAGDIGEGASQHKRDLRAVMGMGWNPATGSNPQKRGLASLAFADAIFPHARHAFAPLEIGYVRTHEPKQRGRQDGRRRRRGNGRGASEDRSEALVTNAQGAGRKTIHVASRKILESGDETPVFRIKKQMGCNKRVGRLVEGAHAIRREKRVKRFCDDLVACEVGISWHLTLLAALVRRKQMGYGRIPGTDHPIIPEAVPKRQIASSPRALRICPLAPN